MSVGRRVQSRNNMGRDTLRRQYDMIYAKVDGTSTIRSNPEKLETTARKGDMS